MTQSQTDSASPNIPWWLVLIEGIFAGILAIISIFIDKESWGLKLIGGLVGIVAGLIVIRHPLWSTILIPSLVVILIAVGGIIIGLVDVVRAFKGAGWGTGILGIVSFLLGVILLLNPVQAAFASTLALGIVALAGGMIAIVMAFKLR